MQELNEMLDVTVSNGTSTQAKIFRHKTLEEQTTEFGGTLEFDGEYNWRESVGSEAW